MKLLLTLFTVATLATSCSDRNSIKPEDIQGVWENISMDVKMNSYKNSDSTNYLNVPEGSWEEVLKIKPIQTTYSNDGTYSSIYKNLEGKVFHTANGQWSIKADSLYLVEGTATYAYKVSIEASKARFVSLLDWDEDGKSDDLYDGWQMKIKVR